MAKSVRASPMGLTIARRRVERATVPTWVKPQLATLVKKAPGGPDWLHEINLDGYRMHARLHAGKVQILTRRGNDWTAKYPTIAEAIAGLAARNANLAAGRRGHARLQNFPDQRG
jgi:ATP-dependent DNA ligase